MQDFLSQWASGNYKKALEDLINNPENPKNNKLTSTSYVNFRSSGSVSGELYKFGPMEGVIEVERILKGSSLTMLQMAIGTNCYQPIKNKKYNNLYSFDPFHPDFKQLKNSRFCASPNVWLFLSKCSAFEPKEQISSTGWEPFFNKSLFLVPVNDNMLNLKTGDNFYTCPFGFYHTIPLKVKVDDKASNVMNLANNKFYDLDDLIEWEPFDCKCGAKTICTKKECHVTNTFRPKIELASLLKGHYRNWQLISICDSSKIYLFIAGKYPISDIDLIKDIYGEICVWEGCRYKTGVNKYASFWSINEINKTKIESS